MGLAGPLVETKRQVIGILIGLGPHVEARAMKDVEHAPVVAQHFGGKS